jgi:hypothetical protein
MQRILRGCTRAGSMRSSAGLRSRNTSTTSPRWSRWSGGCTSCSRRRRATTRSTGTGSRAARPHRPARRHPAARGAARTLLALLEGDARIVEALVPEPAPLVPARGSTRRWSPGGRTLAVLGVLGAAALVGGIQLAKSLTTPRLAVSGPAAGAQLGSATAGSVSFSSPGGRRELQAQHCGSTPRRHPCRRRPVGPARLLPAPPLAGTPRGRRDRRRRLSRRDRASALQLRRRPDPALPRGRADHLRALREARRDPRLGRPDRTRHDRRPTGRERRRPLCGGAAPAAAGPRPGGRHRRGRQPDGRRRHGLADAAPPAGAGAGGARDRRRPGERDLRRRSCS